MTTIVPSGQSDDPAEQLLARFLADHPNGGRAEFSAWAASHSELRPDPILRDRVQGLLDRWLRAAEVIARGLRAGGEKLFFRGGQSDRGAATPDLFPDSTVHVGQRIGPFTLRRHIASGGMGQVWEAWDEQLRRTVALKLVLPERVDLRGLELFAREARAGGRLSHPNIVTTLAYGTDDGHSWIAQELVEGSWTLKDFLDELRAAEVVPKGYYPHVAELVAKLADALEASHNAGVIHRDVKPQNVLIAANDSPKLTDFGLARVSDDSIRSQTGDFAGTYAYMSPEQVTAKRMGLDHRTDVFSLGVVLYELLSLRRPFEGDTTHQVAAKIIAVDPPEPSKVRSQCPRELSIICGKALEKDPGRRYQTMAEFAADLRRHLADQPILARPPGSLVRGLKWARRHPGPSSAAAVGTIALVVISGLLVQQVQTAIKLAAQTQRAKAGELEAEQNADAAEQKTNDVLSLSAQKDLDDLVAEAEELWPAHPEMIPAYEDWLRRANELIEGRPADESRGLKKRPSLAEHQAKLAELQLDAMPLSEAEIQAERESHPRYLEHQAKQAELLWRSRMLALDAWPDEANVESALAQESLPADAHALNALAWPLVDPVTPVYGQEVRALLLARRAVAAATEEQRSGIRDTLAWALLRLGRFDEALSEVRTALSEPGGDALKTSAADLENAVALWRGDELATRREEHDQLAEEVSALTTLVHQRRTYEFEDPEQEWWNRQLVKLVSDLEALMDPATGLLSDVLAEPFGWGVAKRYEFAKSISERSVNGPEAERLWTEAIAAIKSSPKYGGLEVVPQMGLLPIGMDPASQLWEFAHLQTGEPAIRGTDGRLVLTEETGLVFVLIPGGKFSMGAQSTNPNGNNYDRHAEDRESPVHELILDAYLMSKYEMTQGQWLRFQGRNQSQHPPGDKFGDKTCTLLNPMERVTWSEAESVLGRLGVELPTEAQWEYSARAGTNSVWWTGNESQELQGAANVADSYCKKYGGPSSWSYEEGLDDGSTVHASVGSYRPNGFGLHDVIGNVTEWCRDGYALYLLPARRGDGERQGTDAATRMARGGSFTVLSTFSRSAYRVIEVYDSRNASLGLRPSRALRLSSSPLLPPK